MGLTKHAPILLQFAAIAIVSVATSYAFLHTETSFKISGLCFYRYVAYAAAVPLVYVSFAQYKKLVGLAFSVALSMIALSPYGLKAVATLPSLIVFLLLSMGVTTLLILPKARGRGFFEFVVVLVLPAILTESRIGGALQLLATTQSISYLELSAVTVSVVGGYFYLRYANMANLNRKEFLSNGANEIDVASVNSRSNLMIMLTVLAASATSVILMITAPSLANALRGALVLQPLHVLLLAMAAGIAITTILYVFKRSQEELHLEQP